MWVDEEVVPHSGMSLFIRCCPPKGTIGAVPMGATRAATNEKGEEVVPHSGMAVEGCFRLWLDCNVGAPRGIAHCILRKSRRSTHKLEQRTALELASEEMKGDRELCMAAVAQNWEELRHTRNEGIILERVANFLNQQSRDLVPFCSVQRRKMGFPSLDFFFKSLVHISGLSYADSKTVLYPQKTARW